MAKKFLKILLWTLGIGLSAIAGRPLPIWRLFVLFIAFMVLGNGCARVVYDRPGVNVSGVTISPETAIHAAAGAEIARAEAYAIKACADDARHCGGQWGYGGLEMPAGYTLAGMQAAGMTTSLVNSSLERKLDKVINETKTTKEGLKEFFRNRGKNSKTAKKRATVKRKRK